MGFVKLLYGLLAFWCALVGLVLLAGLGGATGAPQEAAAAALAVAAAAIPYIFVRSCEKMAVLRASAPAAATPATQKPVDGPW